MSDEPTTRERRHTPMLIVHTGDGKGKTTAAMGMALRAWAQGWDVGVYQFIKSGKWRVGEEKALRALGHLHDQTGDGGRVRWEHMGTGWSWIRPNLPTSQAKSTHLAGQINAPDRPNQRTSHDAALSSPPLPAPAPMPDDAARAGWAHVRDCLAHQTHDFYLLDEFTYPLANGWLDTADVVATLRERPGHQHVVITGRRAPQKLLDAADLVTEMTKITHPFDDGQRGQAGIEW